MLRVCAAFLATFLFATPIASGGAALAKSPPAVPKIPVERVELPPPVFRSHAMALYGRPRYPADFSHFDHVNPAAPKGGSLRIGTTGGYDSFNPFILKGLAAAGSSAAVETLLVRNAEEELSSYYGLIAETIEWPQGRAWVAFELRPEARWHDGRPITAADVVFSFETLREKGHPRFRALYGDVAQVTVLGPRKVRFDFLPERVNLELPLVMGELPILPAHYWAARDFTATTLEPPLGSGPYRIAAFEPGRFVELERVEDYWGAELAVNVGRNNFDRVRREYYRDATVLREALKAGRVDLRFETTAKAWAQGYDVPPRHAGWLRLEEVPHRLPTGMQALVYNTRRPLFQDPRVRRALAYAFDFEWTNRVLHFGLYERTTSYFSNSEMASSGLPSPPELEVLAPYRGRIPEEVFTTPYSVPTTDGSGWIRDNLRQAMALLNEAGWEVRDLQLVERVSGAPFRFEILIIQPGVKRTIEPFVRNLKRLGIEARIHLVDSAQYVERRRRFDYDMTVTVLPQSATPGNEQRDNWGSAAAQDPGSRNLAGISDPVVDELIELVIAAPDRASLVARTRALDRVLLWGHYVIPQFHARVRRLAVWDKFGRPPPNRIGTTPSYWWWDAEKAAALERARTRGWPLRPRGSTLDCGAEITACLAREAERSEEG